MVDFLLSPIGECSWKPSYTDTAAATSSITYQEILAGNTAILVFPLCVLLVSLVLAAQYESLILPLAIILIVPMCLFSAITGVWLTGGDNQYLHADRSVRRAPACVRGYSH
jgi:multidrug efflux pump subunit AcrB